LKSKKLEFSEKEISQIKNCLKSTTGYQLNKRNTKGWNNNRTKFGYHSIQVGNINILGQRNPLKRLDHLRNFVDFKDKTVIDLGCNVGGMLLHLNDIKKGYGFDYDRKVIKAANLISRIIKSPTIFKVANLNKFSFSIIKEEVDFDKTIIFLFSLGSWLYNWKELYEKVHETGALIILEVNNPEEGFEQLNFFKSLGRIPKKIADYSDDDITGNKNRQCYLINSPPQINKSYGEKFNKSSINKNLYLENSYRKIKISETKAALRISDNKIKYVKIKETPHYSFVKKYLFNEDLEEKYNMSYEDYYDKKRTHLSKEEFINLINSISEKYNNEEPIILYKGIDDLKNIKYWKIVDGFHRIAILSALNKKTIKARVYRRLKPNIIYRLFEALAYR